MIKQKKCFVTLFLSLLFISMPLLANQTESVKVAYALLDRLLPDSGEKFVFETIFSDLALSEGGVICRYNRLRCLLKTSLGG